MENGYRAMNFDLSSPNVWNAGGAPRFVVLSNLCIATRELGPFLRPQEVRTLARTPIPVARTGLILARGFLQNFFGKEVYSPYSATLLKYISKPRVVVNLLLGL